MEPTLDKIYIRDILLRCIIGVNEEERHNKQDVVVNVCLYADLKQACETDNFEYTVDYKSVKQRILALGEESSFYLVEAFAEAIANACLGYDRVEQVDVLVEKPGALRFARTVGVEISRRKGE